jgi:hypothetical protein
MHFELFVAFCNFLVFPVSIVLAVGLNRGQNRIPQIIETALQLMSFNVDSCNGLFIIVEQFNTAPTSDYSKVTA